jgi:hypothetical protein
MTRKIERQPSLGEVGDEIAECIGYDLAVRLIESLPQSGSRPWRRCVYVPERMPLDHKLVQIIGFEAAELLAREFGGLILQPGNGRRRYRGAITHMVLAERRLNYSPREIGIRLGLPRTTVISILEREDALSKPPEADS